MFNECVPECVNSLFSCVLLDGLIPTLPSCRYDKEGHSMEGQSLTEMRSGGGGNANWKTLSDVKTEHLGHGEKVHALINTLGVHAAGWLFRQRAPVSSWKRRP